MSSGLHRVLRVLGIGALVAGGLTIVLIALLVVILLGPLIFWLAWNVLDLALGRRAAGAGLLGDRAGDRVPGRLWFGKVLITAVVFLVDPRGSRDRPGALAGADVP